MPHGYEVNGNAATGRRTVRTEENERAILEGIEVDGLPNKFAAQAVGVSEASFYEWVAAVPAFAEAVKQARARRARALMQHVIRAAPTNWAAAMTALERLEPEEFGKRDRVQHEHAGQVGLQISLPSMDSEAIRMAADLEERLALGEQRLLPSHDASNDLPSYPDNEDA